MNLLIVESPAKAKTIEKYLGKEFKVLATIGHIIDLPTKKISVDIDNEYKPEFEVMADKKKVVSSLKKSIPKDGEVYLAMDPDREGEAIAYHTSVALKLKNPKRVTFNEITKTAVNEAIKSPREVDMNLVNAQFARRVLDRLVGYKVSQVLWKKIRYGLSAGRVQSVALRLIVEREDEIRSFVPQEYWELFADIVKEKSKLSVKLLSIGGKKAKIDNEEQSDSILNEIGKSDFIVKDVKSRDRSVHALPPFTTSTLQQSANNILGYGAKRTMQLAQMLYQKGHITYMRTDSYNLSKDSVESIRNYVGKVYGKEYIPSSINYYKTHSKNAQEAHEAIRPTDIFKNGESLSDCSPQEKKLYELIWKRAVASQMSSYIANVVSVRFNPLNLEKYEFAVDGQKTVFKGFRSIWGYALKEDDNVQEIEDIKKGDIFRLEKLNPIQNFTKPKSRYTEATLVKMLESLGVGRPSTYATIISTVQERGYVTKEEKKLKPTDVGIVVNKFISSSFSRLVDYSYTAKVEERLDEIATGKNKYFPVIDNEYKPLVKEIEIADKTVNKEDLVIIEESDEKCPECGNGMVVKIGKFGKFLSCKRFPDCKGMKSLEEQVVVDLDKDKYITDMKCKLCSKDMVIKSGRFGTYWACVDYPSCKGVSGLLLHEKCPECSSPLVERKGRWGKSFIGCSAYPKCKYIQGAKKGIKKVNKSKANSKNTRGRKSRAKKI